MKILLIAYGTCRFIQIQYNMGIVWGTSSFHMTGGQLAKSMCFSALLFKNVITENKFLKGRTSMYELCLFHFAKNCALST